MYLTIVDEIGSCRSLVMLGDGPGCKVLSDKFFSSVLTRYYYRKYFRHHFLIIIKRKEKKNLPADGRLRA